MFNLHTHTQKIESKSWEQVSAWREIVQYVFQYGVMSEVSFVNCSISDLPYWFLSVKVKTLHRLDPYAPERNYYFSFSSWIFHFSPSLPNALPAARREVICSGHVDHIMRQMKSQCQCELSTWQAVLTLSHSQQWSICVEMTCFCSNSENTKQLNLVQK